MQLIEVNSTIEHRVLMTYYGSMQAYHKRSIIDGLSGWSIGIFGISLTRF